MSGTGRAEHKGDIMAMNGKDLGDAIAQNLYASDASDEAKADVKALWENIGKIIVKHIVDNIEIQIPSGSVIISVAGQATGTPNPSPIKAKVTG